jgi:hypothetical protein
LTPGVNYHERIFIAGPTESGKSELLNFTFSQFHCQRLLYDTKGHEWTIEGVEPVSDPAAIDWSQPIVHYVTTTTDVAEADEVFSQVALRHDLVVAVHELGDLCDYHTNRTPGSVNRTLSQGGAKGLGFYGASQEPVDMPKRAKKEINHAFTMAPAMSAEHLAEVAKFVGGGISGAQMAEEINTLHQQSGDHSFIHWPRGALQEPTAWPPLPDWMRQQSIVKRRRPHARERSRREG